MKIFYADKWWLFPVMLFFTFFVALGSAAGGETTETRADVLHGDNYLIGPGDVLEISLWKDEALSRLVTVRPDGKISFPLVGEFTAAGKTAADLKNNMEKKIAHYAPEPVLTVIVQQINSLIVYVIGRINRPGHYVLNSNVNVLQILSMAGGLNPFADKKTIKILRKKNEKTEIFYFNYKEVAEGNHLEQNIILKRGDVVVVQ